MKLAVGILLIFMSFIHVVYGEKMQVNVLKKLKADNILIGSYRVMSLQGALIVFAVGVIEVLTFVEVITLTGFAAFIPLGVICLNVLSVFIVAILKHQALIKATIPQFLIFVIIITLQTISVV